MPQLKQQQKRFYYIIVKFSYIFKTFVFVFCFVFVILIISKYLLVFMRITYNCQCENLLKISMIFIHNIKFSNALHFIKGKLPFYKSLV